MGRISPEGSRSPGMPKGWGDGKFSSVLSIDESVHWYWYWFFQSTDHFWYWCTDTGTGTGPVFKYWLCTGTDRPSTESISISTNKVKTAKLMRKNWRPWRFPKYARFFFWNFNLQYTNSKLLLYTWISLMKIRFFSRKFQISGHFLVNICCIGPNIGTVLVLYWILFWYWY